MLVALSAFKEQRGHCDVPLRFAGKLGFWCHNQRTSKKAGRLSNRQFEQLDALGFSWEPNDAAWEARFAELVSYKTREGHCNVPATYPANPELGRWVAMQRRLRKGFSVKKSTVVLSPERVRRLDELGFIWVMDDAVWVERIADLRAFKEEEGHFDIGDARNVPRGKKALAVWVSSVRQRKKRGSLTEEQIHELTGLGFQFDPKSAVWETRFAELKRFKALEGHCRVPATYEPNPALGHWVSMQRRRRFRRNTLSREQVQRLTDLGFVWDLDVYEWESKLKALLAFKVSHGHCNVPARYSSDTALGAWVSEVRGRSKSRLSKTQIAQLKKLGFQWRLRKR